MSFNEEVIIASEIKVGDCFIYKDMYEVIKRGKSRNGRFIILLCKDPILLTEKTVSFYEKTEVQRIQPREKIVEILGIQSGILLCMNHLETEEIEVADISSINEDNLPVKAVLREYPNEKIHTIKAIL